MAMSRCERSRVLLFERKVLNGSLSLHSMVAF